ncbi:MAG: VanZ family protein [Lachnospiraceae bacterium]|nr:VanZ family protein [Lachnospiraceae bacterium]
MGYVIESLEDYVFLLPIWILMEVFLCLYYKRKGLKPGVGFLIGFQLLACLVTAMLNITGVTGIESIIKYGIRSNGADEWNLIPLVGLTAEDLFGTIMNIILFVPLGVLLPMLWKRGTSWWQTVLAGFSFSLLIELLQLFNWRATDVNDLIMNTLGAALGYGIYYLLFKKIKLLQLDNQGTNVVVIYNAIICLFIFTLLYFLVGDSIISFIWRHISG